MKMAIAAAALLMLPFLAVSTADAQVRDAAAKARGNHSNFYRPSRQIVGPTYSPARQQMYSPSPVGPAPSAITYYRPQPMMAQPQMYAWQPRAGADRLFSYEPGMQTGYAQQGKPYQAPIQAPMGKQVQRHQGAMQHGYHQGGYGYQQHQQPRYGQRFFRRW